MTDSKVVIVSGGTFGLGREISCGLAQRGHRVVAFGLDDAQEQSTAVGSVTEFRQQVETHGLPVEVMSADASKTADVHAVVERTLQLHGRIDALVNNAAIGPLGTVLDTSEELFDKIVGVNLKGTFLCSKAVLPHLLDEGGSIVNVGSGAGWGKPNMSAYAASKGGVFALSASMAYDFMHDRVRVNTIVPGGGGIMSGMTIGRVGGDPGKVDRGAPGSAAGRPVNGQDMASTVAFLIGDESQAISGTVIDIGCFANQGGPAKRKDSK